MSNLAEELCKLDFWVFVVIQLIVTALLVLAVWNSRRAVVWRGQVRERVHRVYQRIVRQKQTESQPPHYRKDEEERGKEEVSLKLEMSFLAEPSVKRGELSWRRIYTAFAVLLVVAQVPSTAQLSFLEGWRAFVSVTNIFVLSYLTLFNAWFKNKLVGGLSKLENRWEDL